MVSCCLFQWYSRNLNFKFALVSKLCQPNSKIYTSQKGFSLSWCQANLVGDCLALPFIAFNYHPVALLTNSNCPPCNFNLGMDGLFSYHVHPWLWWFLPFRWITCYQLPCASQTLCIEDLLQSTRTPYFCCVAEGICKNLWEINLDGKHFSEFSFPCPWQI